MERNGSQAHKKRPLKRSGQVINLWNQHEVMSLKLCGVTTGGSWVYILILAFSWITAYTFHLYPRLLSYLQQLFFGLLKDNRFTSISSSLSWRSLFFFYLSFIFFIFYLWNYKPCNIWDYTSVNHAMGLESQGVFAHVTLSNNPTPSPFHSSSEFLWRVGWCGQRKVDRVLAVKTKNRLTSPSRKGSQGPGVSRRPHP